MFFSLEFLYATSSSHLFQQGLMLALIGASCSFVGSFLFYRRATMLANAISHTALLGVVLAFFLQGVLLKQDLIASTNPTSSAPLPTLSLALAFVASLFVALLTYATTSFLIHKLHLPHEASIAMVLSAYFSLGILLLSLFARNSHVGIETIMGNIDALAPGDLQLSSLIFFLTALVLVFFYKELLVTSFDLPFAQAVGMSAPSVELVLIFLTSAVVVSSFKAVGYILVLAYMVGLPLLVRLLLGTAAQMQRLLFGVFFASLFLSFASLLTTHLLYLYAGLALSTSGISVTLLLTSITMVRVALFFSSWREGKQKLLITALESK